MGDTPIGVARNNPGDLMNYGIPWQGLRPVQPPEGQVADFVDVRWGIRAMAKTLLAYWHQDINTIRLIVTRYAPPSENPTEAYIAHVVKWTEHGPDDVLELENGADLGDLVEAMIEQEVGLDPDGLPRYSAELIDEAVNVALGLAQPTDWPVAA